MGVTRGRERRRRRGMAMLEMVFVLPVLLMLVFAIAELGLMFSRWLTLSNAVREGARLAVVYRDDCVPANVMQAVRDRVVAYARAGGVGISDGDVTVTGACSSGNPANVSASFDFQFQVLPGFAPLGSSIPLQYASEMRNE